MVKPLCINLDAMRYMEVPAYKK
jgi:hypothetical protein